MARRKKMGKTKKYFAENWVSLLLLLIVIILLIIGIVYSQKGCSRSLKNNNFEYFDTNSSEPCMVMFYAPWCGFCKKTMPDWEKLESSNPKNSTGKKVKVIKINCDENKELASKYNIKGYPTIKYFTQGLNGAHRVDFNGDRNINGFLNFIKSQ